MKDVSCIFCGKQSDHIVITENGYAGRKCWDCRIIFISPRPSADEITHLYTNTNVIIYADAQFLFERFKRKVAALTLTKIKKYIQYGALLELGAGGGFFLKEARNWGFDPYGIELNPIETRWINEKLDIPCENAALHKGSFGNKQFEIIYHNDVLSHFYDPIDVFININRALKKDGLLVFETGNIADVDGKYYKLFSQFMYPDHMFFFGEHSLKLLLERTGFEYVSIYRESLFFQLLLQKALWSVKDLLKDKRVLEDMKTHQGVNYEGRGLSVKRQLRLLYRYVNYYLVRVGKILPINGRPLKLLVVARKKSNR